MAGLREQLEQALLKAKTWKQNAAWWGKPPSMYDGTSAPDPRSMLGPEDMVNSRNVEDIAKRANRTPEDWYSFAKNQNRNDANAINQANQPPPVKAQNKAMKNRVINNTNPYTGGEFEPEVHSPSAQRMANYENQILKNPNKGIYDVGYNDPYGHVRNLEELTPYEYGGKPLVNKLATPLSRLPVVGGMLDAINIAKELQAIKNDGGGWLKWSKPHPEDL